MHAYLFRIEVGEVGARHVLGEPDGPVADLDSVQDDVLELVPGVAGAELARVGVHRECHGDGRVRGGCGLIGSSTVCDSDGESME